MQTTELDLRNDTPLEMLGAELDGLEQRAADAERRYGHLLKEKMDLEFQLSQHTPDAYTATQRELQHHYRPDRAAGQRAWIERKRQLDLEKIDLKRRLRDLEQTIHLVKSEKLELRRRANPAAVRVLNDLLQEVRGLRSDLQNVLASRN